MRIALIDDDVVSRVRRVEDLEAEGCQVLAAPDSQQLVERLSVSGDIGLAVVVLCGRDLSDFQDERSALAQLPQLVSVPVVGLVDSSVSVAVKRQGLPATHWCDLTISTPDLIEKVRSIDAIDPTRGTAVLVPAMVLELTQALSSKLQTREILSLVVRRIGEVLGVARVSIVLTTGNDQAFVVTASDDTKLKDLPIQLDAYPEIQQALDTRRVVEILEPEVYQPFATGSYQLPKQIRSLTLCPILFEDNAKGVIFLRYDRRRKLSADELFLLRAVANATGIALRNAQLMSSLREYSVRSTTAHAAAERQVHAMQRYLDFFNSSADGIFVIDLSGTILFCNPAAGAVFEVAAEELIGVSLKTLVSPDGSAALYTVLEKLAASADAERLDLPVLTSNKQRRVLDVSVNRGTSEDAIAIVGIRDVTHERSIARELNRTKGFLESVIESSVDAIVSADTRGVVRVYNRAAESVYGWPIQDVIGKMNVRELYPKGVALEVMRLIRSGEHGSEGTLREYETELLDCDGQRVPARLSAALIHHRGRTIGSVGIFHDLRERRRIEHRLAQTEKELAAQERKALIAELAGTAAHELNQPLTAMMAYAQLVTRHVQDSPDARRITERILAEADRMAQVVKKIGTITSYETKAYVGSTRILDLGGGPSSDIDGEVQGKNKPK